MKLPFVVTKIKLSTITPSIKSHMWSVLQIKEQGYWFKAQQFSQLPSRACTSFWGFAPHFGLLPHLLVSGGASQHLLVPSSREKHKTGTSQTLLDSHIVLLLQTSGLDTNLESLEVLSAPCVVRHMQLAKHKWFWENLGERTCGLAHPPPADTWGPPHTMACCSTFHQWETNCSFRKHPLIHGISISVQILLFQSRKEHHPDSSVEHGEQHTECHGYRKPCTNSCHRFTSGGCGTWPSCQNFHQATNHNTTDKSNIIKTILLAQMNKSRFNEKDC